MTIHVALAGREATTRRSLALAPTYRDGITIRSTEVFGICFLIFAHHAWAVSGRESFNQCGLSHSISGNVAGS